MRLKQFSAMLKARTMEFVRDRGTLIWNLFFPLVLVIGFGFAFSGSGEKMFKVGILGPSDPGLNFLKTSQIEFIPYERTQGALEKVLTRLRQHQIEMVMDPENKKYWVNEESPKSRLVKQIFTGDQALQGQKLGGAIFAFTEEAVTGKAVRYVDWVVPGVIGMNIMMSCLFGVGFVIVRYRKNGVLKRLKATPVSALNFVMAQGTSRLIIVLVTAALVYFGTNLIFGFTMNGNFLDLFILTTLSILSMIALGLVFASRFKSEELANGLMNLVTFPMLIFSGVFFSLEGAPQILQTIAQAFPLTHFTEGARKIMLDGAGLGAVAPDLLYLGVLTAGLMALSAWLFKWE